MTETWHWILCLDAYLATTTEIMNLLESQRRINTLMSYFVVQINGATAMGQTDINRVSETVLIPLFAEVFGYKHLKNLNTTERANYPGVDLGDDVARVAFQITSTKNLSKVKNTLRKFIDHGLHEKYDRLFIYILTKRQEKYSKDACKTIVQDAFDFDPNRDILDYRDVLGEIEGFDIDKTRRIQDILEDNFGEGRTLPDIPRGSPFPTELVDQSIKKEVSRLRKSRFFPEFDEIGCALALSRKLVDGDLYDCTNSVKSWALAWCARILSSRDKLDEAEELIKQAESLGGDTKTVSALICSQKGDKSTALNILAGIDSPHSRSIAFLVVGHHDSPQGAIEWLRTAGIEARDLDADSKLKLISLQFELGQWGDALETANVLSEGDLEEVPVLHYVMAMSYLLSAVPSELRNLVFCQVPFEAATFPLASDNAAINARRTAHRHFISAAETAKRLDCPKAGLIPDVYACWLELSDPELSDEGQRRLKYRLHGSNPALHLVPLGLQFGIELDLETVEKAIDRHIALHGDITPESALARSALALSQQTPKDVADYVDRHFIALSKYFDEKAMRFLQIEMFSQAGLPEKASEYLDLLLEQGLSEKDEGRYRTVIAKAEGRDSLELRKDLFEQTGSLIDLMALVRELEKSKQWDVLCEYGEILFERTRSLQDAERLATALHNAGLSDRIVGMLEKNVDVLAQSIYLRVLYCWALYHEGELSKAHSQLEQLTFESENEDFRDLQVKIGLASGDWYWLSTYVANEYRQREIRSAQELIGAARLSLYLSLPYAKDLLVAATEKGSKDADVLATAYFLAANAGWEDDVETTPWLHKALELSGDDGPLVRMTLKDVIDQRPKWIRQESEISELLNRGEIPMCFLSHSFNIPLVKLMLYRAFADFRERDPRRRGGIPAFSGQRQPPQFDIGGTVGLDVTALLTLSFLNLLDAAFNSFGTIFVPHSTLPWLFEEKQKTSFHQPSRIRDAHQIRDLVARNVLAESSPSTIADRRLTSQVGDGLARLLAEAQNGSDDESQRLVVRPSPVNRIDIHLEEEVDLSDYAAVLSSCQSLVDKLYQMGEITAYNKGKAHAYLKSNGENPWPQQPEITDKARLYLDDLAVYYLLHLGILEKLHTAGFRLVVSPRMLSDANALIAYERTLGEASDALEKIIHLVSQGIESGKVKVGKWRNVDEWEEQSISAHLIVEVLALAEDCNAIIADDRFLNQHLHIENDGIQTPLHSTIDLLDALASVGSIAPNERLEYRSLLRRAGYFFVPIDEDELTQHLKTATVSDERVNETAELRAIRENILCVRMNDWLQVPKEEFWLDSILKVYVSVLRNLWRPGVDIPGVKARSNWILDQIDVRGWAHSFGVEDRENIVKTGRGGIIFMLMTTLPDVPRTIWEAYRTWIEDSVLKPLKEEFPDLYAWIVELKRKQILELADADLPEEEQYGE